MSAVDLTEHYISRTQRLSEQVGAFVTQRLPNLHWIRRRPRMSDVRAADVDDRLPTLLGVVPVKDLDFVAGVPTRFGSTVYDITPEADANVVVRMRSGGLVFTGKTNTRNLAFRATRSLTLHRQHVRRGTSPNRRVGRAAVRRPRLPLDSLLLRTAVMVADR